MMATSPGDLMSTALIALLVPFLKRRQNVVLHARDALLPVDLPHHALALVVLDQRHGLPEVDLEALAGGLYGIIGALEELAAAQVALTRLLRRVTLLVIHRLALPAGPAARQTA